jgi:hypothetical protein
MERLNFTTNNPVAMKSIALFLTMAFLGIASCSSSKQARSSSSDDVYFSSKDAKAEAEANEKKRTQSDYTPAPSQSSGVSNDAVQQGNGDYFDPNAQRTTTQTTDGSGNTYITNNYNSDFNYDDYYDYAYSSRIRRFHSSNVAWSYYDPFFTNVYYYDYDPFFWGNSIYLGYSWWAPVNNTVVWGGGPAYGGWYNPYYRPWIYTNSWYYGNCGGWWNTPNYWGSGWGFNYGYGYGGNGWGYGGWGRPWGSQYGWGYNNGYWNGYNNGYWHGYNQGLNNSFYYNSLDANTYYYGPRNSSSATGGYNRKSFSENYEGVVAKETGSYNRFTPVASVDRPAGYNNGGLSSGARPTSDKSVGVERPGSVSRPETAAGSSRPSTSIAPDAGRPGYNGQVSEQNARPTTPVGQNVGNGNSTRPAGNISGPATTIDANPRGSNAPSTVPGSKDLNNTTRPAPSDYSRPVQSGRPASVAPDYRTQPSAPAQQNSRPVNPTINNDRPRNQGSQAGQDDYYRPSQQNSRPAQNNNVRPGTPSNSYQDYQRGNDYNRPSSTPRGNNYQPSRENSQPIQQMDRGSSRPSSVTPPSSRPERPANSGRSVSPAPSNNRSVSPAPSNNRSVSPSPGRGSSGGSLSAPSGGSRSSGGSVGGGVRRK